MEIKKIWYAVLKDTDDNDWGTGSYDLKEAMEMVEQYGDEAYIAVIEDGDDPVCINELHRDEGGDWTQNVGCDQYGYVEL